MQRAADAKRVSIKTMEGLCSQTYVRKPRLRQV